MKHRQVIDKILSIQSAVGFELSVVHAIEDMIVDVPTHEKRGVLEVAFQETHDEFLEGVLGSMLV
jgi:hypothetical protein